MEGSNEDGVEIYDYENPVANPTRYADMRERNLIPELLLNVQTLSYRHIIEKAQRTVEAAIGELESPTMKYLHYSRSQLCECMYEMFDRLSLISAFRIDSQKLKNLIKDVSHHYKRVPYHNFTHAFNIVHMCYFVLRTTKLREYLDDVDVLAIMIGGLGHDIDHSGLNNTFYIKTNHPIAQAVNSNSVLENYHSYMLFKLLKRPENDVLGNLSQAERERFKKAAVSGILGTDMTKHFSICTSFEKIITKL